MNSEAFLPGRLSIGDVAKASGVSVATVSRVLNGLDGVSQETALRVRGIVEKLAYRPLRTRRRQPGEVGSRRTGTGNLAVITLGQSRDWLQLPVMAAAIDGIRAATERAGYRSILSEVVEPSRPGVLFEKKEIDGALVFVSSSFDSREIGGALQALNERLPVVWVMGGPMAVEVDHIYPDHYRIGQLAHEYLMTRGCKEMAYVTTSPTWPLMRVRGHGFLDAGCDAGRPVRAFVIGKEPSLKCSYGQNAMVAENMRQLVRDMAEAIPTLDGLYMGNDRTAVELYPLMIEAGIQPGRDVTVISCDNEETRLSGLHPRPASIDLGAEQIGRRSVARLLKRIAEPDEPPVSIQVTPKLVLPPQ